MSDLKPIQVLSPKFEVDECLAEIRQCLEKGWTGMGFKTVELEQEWCNYTGHAHAHYLNSNTSGLELALRILADTEGWDEGDEVISTPFTFVSTNHAILHQRLTPVLADIDEYLCLDPEAVRSRITPKTKAIMYVGHGGNTGKYEEIREIAQEAGVKLILDAAHMAGTRWNGAHVGPESEVAIYSFQAVKNLPTADSGMICFQDEALDAAARKYSWLGIDKDTFSRTSKQGSYKWHYDVDVPGFKFHGNSVVASLGLVALRYLDRDNAYRRELADLYANGLKDIDDMSIVPTSPDCVPSRHLFQIRSKQRNKIYEHLVNQQIFAGVHYRNNCEYAMYADQMQFCPNAQAASEEILSLPLHLNLTHNDVSRVIAAVKEAVA